MKKTIGSLALLVSVSSANALIAPGGPNSPQPEKACIEIYSSEEGVQYASSCNSARNNKISGKKILENGCAEGQASFAAVNVKLPLCMPPNVAQL